MTIKNEECLLHIGRENHFSLEGIVNRKNERLYAPSRQEADEQGDIN
jgi:hypothetical protein